MWLCVHVFVCVSLYVYVPAYLRDSAHIRNPSPQQNDTCHYWKSKRFERLQTMYLCLQPLALRTSSTPLATRPIVPERGERGAAGPMILSALTLAEPHVRVPTSFVKFNNALAIFNEALTVQ